MKRKVLLSALAAMAFVLSFSVAKADDEGGGPSIGNCNPPTTNTCYNVYKNGVLIATAKGVLHV